MLLSSLLAFLLCFSGGIDHPVLARAMSSIGIPYRFGGTSVTRGFDCAGFVRYAYEPLGVALPRTTDLQYTVGEPVEQSELVPGDLVFFRNTYRSGISHVGIYIGNRRFVHAASSSRQIRVDELDATYYSARYAGSRRVVQSR